MKNLNPASGLKQVSEGYLCLPRRIILKQIRNKKIKPIELAYFLIFLISTDWDEGPYRKGYIRHRLRRLSKIWNLPYTTLYDYMIKLKNKGLLMMEENTPKIKNFSYFTPRGAQEFARSKLNDEGLRQLFPNILCNSEISESYKSNEDQAFNISSKVKSNINFKRVIIKQEIRSDKEYQEIYDKGEYLRLTVDDMRWIDENIKERKQTNNRLEENDIVNIFFNGNRNLYKNNLIYDN